MNKLKSVLLLLFLLVFLGSNYAEASKKKTKGARNTKKTSSSVSATPALSGAGTLEDPYQIATYNDIQTLSAMCHESEGKYYKLMQDISIPISYSSIGTFEKPFKGIFDGNGLTILFENTVMLDSDAGLFGVNFGKIHNLVIAGTLTSKNSRFIGAVVGSNYGVISNCVNKSSITANTRVGGIAGFSQGTIKECTNEGNMSISLDDTENMCGGIAGEVSLNAIILSCNNLGTISIASRSINICGGIAGKCTGNADIKMCGNQGKVISTNGIEDYAGGIAGRSTGKITNSYNLGEIRIENTSNVSEAGGIVGVNNGTVQHCYSIANIISQDGYMCDAGGIVAYNENGTVQYCYSISTFQSKGDKGGIIGTNWTNGQVSDCFYICDDKTVSGISYDYGMAEKKKASSNKGAGLILEDDLKSNRANLGNMFKADCNKNQGYPVLKWQCQ